MDNGGKDAYSSEDEIRRPVVKRKKKAKNTITSDTEEEEDSDIDIKPRRLTKPRRCESEDENNNGRPTSSGSNNCTESLNDLSDNDQADKCAICLSKFLGQDIATPETCDHVFCLECIQEWAKNVNTCPIDRLKFNLILIRHHKEEKIIKTIFVNNSALPYTSDSETESQGQADYCDLCGEDKNEGALLRCHECHKFYHYHCILPALHPTPSDTWQCPACENFIWGAFARMTPSAFRVYQSLNSGIRTPSPTRSTLHSSSQEFLRLRRRVLYPRSVIQRLLSSESSEEDVHNSVPSSVYWNPLISSLTSKARCPLLRKRRNLCRARNRALVSATSAATESTYTSDSDDGYRFAASTPETFDVVGSILESQTRLHCPDILTLARDGTLLQTPKIGSSPRLSNIASSTSDFEESAQSSFNSSLPSDNNTKLPLSNNTVVKQRPLHPSHGNSSKYGEASMQAYSCSSSGTPRERTLSYDENPLARPAHGTNSNDRFGNEPCSPVVQKGFCLSASTDDMKKDGRPTKGQHSEDEVDIYSDIESVGEEDGVTNDSVEPAKVAFKCDDSQLSNPNDSSDLSDNDLVIDEDQQADEDHEKFKDSQQSNKEKINQTCDSEESNMSSNAASDQEQLTVNTALQNPSSPRIENSSDNCFNPGDESSHGVFANDESNHSKLNSEHENTSKYESDSDAGPQVSDVDMQEDGENSVDSAKKSYQGDAATPCTSVKSSPKSCRGETADGFEMQGENSISNENSQSNIDNVSLGEQEESKEVFEEVSNQENDDTCNSGSRGAEAENFENENNYNLSEPTSPVEKIDNQKSFDFVNHEQNASEPDEPMEVATSREEHNNNSELINICNDISMKSDEEDNLDSIENASTPCMDENLDGQIENSPMHVENSEEEANDLEKTSQLDSEEEKEDSENENAENKSELVKSVESSPKLVSKEDPHDGSVDLGIEDISDAGSEEISNVLGEEHLPSTNVTEEEFDDVERKVASLFSPIPPDEDDCIIISKQDSAEFTKCSPPQTNQSFEDQEEGEIIEERPVHRCKKKKNRTRDSTGEYGEYAPRVNISDLPRIPKLKRDRDKDSIPETLSFDNKRTSVLSRVDLGGDISWKRLSKHTRERSYRDGRPKDERLLFRERESRKKSKKSSNDASRRNDSKNSERRRDEKKVESEKSKGDYDSRSRKSEKNKSLDYSSEREKRKTHKDSHSSKDRHSKDNKKEKDKYDKKYSKDDDKYEREKLKDEIRFERDSRYDKGERFERIVYEKGKFKEKEHKSKHKDRKSETSKTCKEHSREKHKHSHSGDHFSDKQREVRKIDDKIKIVVEQKESRKDKSKHKDKKETKIERKQIIQRKVEPPERSPYKEITSIESKEIFAKGDSIIINVNFNRAVSPKVTAAPENNSNVKERKVLSDDQEVDEKLTSADVKSKSKPSVDKTNSSLDNSVGKRPTTPTGKNTSVLSVSESYWQGGEDPDGNNSPASEKSVEIISDEVETEAAGSGETNSCSSPEARTVQTDAKNSTLLSEKTSLTPINEATDSILKESDSFSSKRRSPRSPSPPSPADNDSYDPCEPTRSPSPPPMPPSPPLPTTNPKPPPSPELPPLPPEPEPTEDKPNPPDFVSSTVTSNTSQANTVQTQTSTASPMQSLLLPPSFLSRVSAATNTLQGVSPLAPSRNGNFQMNNIMLPPNQMQQMMGANFMPHMGGSTLQPPPNPPNMSLPPPPPPPTGMTLLSQTRHPRMNVQPPLTPSSLLQSLTMVHNVNTAPIQLIHHLPPNLSGILANHPSTIVQNPPPSSLPVSTANQQVMRMIFSQQNQMPNHGAFLPSQTANNCNKSQGNLVSSGSLQQKSDKQSKRSPSAEKNEVIDMDVGTPYSPGDSPSVDSVGDYSPAACSPEASSPKNKDVFDSLFSANQRTSEKRTHDSISTNEKPKAHSTSKKSKHEHKKHAVRMQVKEKHKKSRKEQKQVDEAELKILDELPSSAVEMQVKEKYMVKLNRQERVVDEVKNLLKPLYKTRDVTKEEYKDILRKAVPKICHNRSGDINLRKIRSLVESYVKKAKHSRKKGDKRKSKFS